jgi:hypothetical protein
MMIEKTARYVRHTGGQRTDPQHGEAVLYG